MRTREELINDYEAVDNATISEKKEFATKYGIDSKKAKDIQYAILVEMRSLRFNSTIFDDIDLRYFYRLSDYKGTLVDYVKQESVPFIEFLITSYESRLQKRNLMDKLYMANSRSYSISVADKYLIKSYLDIKKGYNEVVNADSIAKINEVLLSETVEFKNNYIAIAKETADRRYDYAQDNIERLVEKCKNKEEESKIEKAAKGIRSWVETSTDIEVKEMKKTISFFRMILRYDKATYVENEGANAEKEYYSNIAELSDRLYNHEIDADSMSVNCIESDMKLFNMIIADGKGHNLWCRSIIAAEYSSLVATHIRFIITDRK